MGDKDLRCLLLHRTFVTVAKMSRIAPVVALVCVFGSSDISQAPSKGAAATQVVLLGTGTPLPDPERFGPCTAIVVNGTPYLVDFGPGLVRRASAAYEKGVLGLQVKNLKIGFLTHLHVDHTMGFPDVLFTPWIMGRTDPLEVYGPRGTRSMAEHIEKAYQEDTKIRTESLEHSNTTGYKVNVHEIKPGIVHQDGNATVNAFAVRHGDWAKAYGYRFESQDRTVVISGDTSPTPAIVENCNGCDVLIHEVYTQSSFGKISQQWQAYRSAYHTSSKELAVIANRAKPALLILYHRGNAGCDQAGTKECKDAGREEQLLKEIRQVYAGRVVAGHDLDIY